jgi:two-component system response regulator AtoC
MAEVRQRLERLAATNVPVLVRGENGTGKEIIARMIHRKSPWSQGPFVKVSCPAIPGTLLESELFGYEKGAFTGAYNNKPGRVQMAERGTLFLDEIAEMDAGLQAKLLQLLQDGQFCPIGGREDKRVDVRMVCATNRDLEHEIEFGNFRQDLFYRINVVSLELPPLRERKEDIPVLIEYFLSHYSHKFNGAGKLLSNSMMQSFQQYAWPGNIRELENLIKRYVILGSENAIADQLVNKPNGDLYEEAALDGSVSLKKLSKQASRELERKVILKVLQENHWNRKQAARILKISYRALLYKLKEAGFVSSRAAEAAAARAAAPAVLEE